MPVETNDDQDVANNWLQLTQAMFLIKTWNCYKAGTAGIAKITNAVEGWHFGLQARF